MSSPRKPQLPGRIVRKEIRTTASPAAVWTAWTDPVRLAQWFVDSAHGKTEANATTTWCFEQFGNVEHEVLEAVPERRFRLECKPPGGALVHLEIKLEQIDGETVIRLVQSGLGEGVESNEQVEGVDSGWQVALAILKHYLENYDGQSRSRFFVSRPASFEYERLAPYYRDGELLGDWLAESGAIGPTGDEYSLELAGGGTMSGTVLARTRYEVALSWREINGIIELKGYRDGNQRMIAIRGCGWSLDREKIPHIEGQLGAALDRLAKILGDP